MIELKNITKSYWQIGFSRYYVLRNLSLQLPSRTHVGLIGRNGAGKSTLLRLIGGIELPDSGSVVADGAISPPLGLASGFAGKVSGRDNAKFVCRINGDDIETERERVAFIQSFSELGEFFERPVSNYSSGMKARLAFSISMAFDFDYYLIDELTAVGDQAFRLKAKATFLEKKGRASIIMASHNLEGLKRDCQCGIYVARNNAVFYDDIGDAVEAYHKDHQKP